METICSESNNFVNLNMQGYNCIQGFFILINQRANKLVVQDDDCAKAAIGAARQAYEQSSLAHKKLDQEMIQVRAVVAPNEMEGIAVLWKIALDCQDKKIGEQVLSMILQVHTSVDFGLDDRITMFEDQLIERCLNIIKQ